MVDKKPNKRRKRMRTGQELSPKTRKAVRIFSISSNQTVHVYESHRESMYLSHTWTLFPGVYKAYCRKPNRIHPKLSPMPFPESIRIVIYLSQSIIKRDSQVAALNQHTLCGFNKKNIYFGLLIAFEIWFDVCIYR